MPVKKRITGRVKPPSIKPSGKPSTEPELVKKDDLSDLVSSVHAGLQGHLTAIAVQRIRALASGELLPSQIGSGNILLIVFATASYAYYVKDDPLLPDSVFDAICKRGLSMCDKPEFDMLKPYKSDFKSGSGYALDYSKIRAPDAESVYNMHTIFNLAESLNNADSETKKTKVRPAPKRAIRTPTRVLRKFGGSSSGK